jgi:hypothetical protein
MNIAEASDPFIAEFISKLNEQQFRATNKYMSQ